jgi:hypothetical protein
MKSKLKPSKSPERNVGVIIGQHPFEEAASEVGVNLVRALNDAKVDAELIIVPDKVTYPRVLSRLFKSFEDGSLGKNALKANLMLSNHGREALLWIKELVESDKGRVFYSLHNYVAGYNGRGEEPFVSWGSSDMAGWCQLKELTVRTYKTEEDAMLHVSRKLGRFWSHIPLTGDEVDSMRCHIQVALGPSGYHIQTGDRQKLKQQSADEVKETRIPYRVVEAPAVQTHFKGWKTPKPTDEELRDRYMFQDALYAGEDDMHKAFGISKKIKDGELRELLLWLYCTKWGVFDREINRRLGLTGDHIVDPLREFIVEDLKCRSKSRQ